MVIENEKVLIKKATKGDQEAFRELFEAYYPRVYNLAYSIMRNKDDAEEVLQEAFVKAYLGLKNFKGDSSFYTWLYRIVRNMAIDVKRKLSRRFQAAPEEPDHKRISEEDSAVYSVSGRPDDLYETKEALTKVQKALLALKEEQRTILILREIDGLSYEEIAQVCSLNTGTVMSRLFYARKALKKALEDLDDQKSDDDKTSKIPGLVPEAS